MRVQDPASTTDTNAVYYPLTDHLGSTSVTAYEDGTYYSELRYKPWGATRLTSGQTPTDFGYTGQRSNESDFGLLFYNARWYDSSLGRFTSADTVVPGAGNPGAWDRFLYVQNNPFRYSDPTGHYKCDKAHVAEEDCSDMNGEQILAEYYGVVTFDPEFTAAQITAVYFAVRAVGEAFVKVLGNDQSAAEAFKQVFGGIAMKWCQDCVNGFGWASGDHEITWDGMYANIETAARNVVHELGHLLDRAVCASNSATGSCYDSQGNDLIWGDGTARADLSAFWSGCATDHSACLTRDGHNEDNPNLHYGFAGGFGSWQFGATHGNGEIFADMFLGWVYDTWEASPTGGYRRDYMNSRISQYLTTNLVSP